MGETFVPVNSKQVIGLDWVTCYSILALGIEPTGCQRLGPGPPNIKGELEEVVDIGGNPPNLEKIALLKPDLILGWNGKEIYNKLSEIAPTVLKDWEHSGKWKEMLRFYAEVLGKTTTAEQLMRDYYQRIGEFQQQMGERLQHTEVSVIRIRPGVIDLDLKDSFAGAILEDVGLSRPSAQDKDGFQTQISKERIRDADGDVIFLWTFGGNPEVAQEAQTALKNLKKDPLWSKLNAVQQDRVYEVPSYWFGGSIESAYLVLGDLFKYLLPKS